jgi:mono/diheme cytochrome c family protein
MKYIFLLISLLSITYVSLAQTKKPNEGKKTYNQYCLACHQADGAGVPNMNPPLRKSEWVNGDKERLIKVILKGLKNEEIEVLGETYQGFMAPHDFLNDKQIAEVLTYIRANFENKSSNITLDEVKKVRENP